VHAHRCLLPCTLYYNNNDTILSHCVDTQAASAAEVLVARTETSNLQAVVDTQRTELAQRRVTIDELTSALAVQERQCATLEDRRQDMANRARAIKHELERELADVKQKSLVLQGRVTVLEDELSTCRKQVSWASTVILYK
jgi:chromosome segregation ATPase